MNEATEVPDPSAAADPDAGRPDHQRPTAGWAEGGPPWLLPVIIRSMWRAVAIGLVVAAGLWALRQAEGLMVIVVVATFLGTYLPARPIVVDSRALAEPTPKRGRGHRSSAP